MKVICAWCAKEGKLGDVNEKGSVSDSRETHGICRTHSEKLKANSLERLKRKGYSEYEQSYNQSS